ncbi:MAG: hypothetical protein Tp152SUR00d2C52646391_19 [Prokaryotic dsDNA virus sp.]|nr:MAG: hypothetical protein Tp152SUR00d2C52646391_19 [Prokaryotic dsDNA virus sp.]|tara:strand:+ start:1906 stop:2166 length:261 start_codon:yes stop_codon:yes gene_type:complete
MTHKTLKVIENTDFSDITIDTHLFSAAGANYTNFSVSVSISLFDPDGMTIEYIIKVGSKEVIVYEASEIKPTLIQMVSEQMELNSK